MRTLWLQLLIPLNYFIDSSHIFTNVKKEHLLPEYIKINGAVIEQIVVFFDVYVAVN